MEVGQESPKDLLSTRSSRRKCEESPDLISPKRTRRRSQEADEISPKQGRKSLNDSREKSEVKSAEKSTKGIKKELYLLLKFITYIFLSFSYDFCYELVNPKI